jgi:hypothetical protein
LRGPKIRVFGIEIELLAGDLAYGVSVPEKGFFNRKTAKINWFNLSILLYFYHPKHA